MIEMKKDNFALNFIAISYPDRITPVCLPLEEPLLSRKFIGTTPFVIGFGETSQNGKSAEVLQQLQVPIVNNRICKNFHLKFGVSKKLVAETIDEHVLCAGIQANKGVWKGMKSSI